MIKACTWVCIIGANEGSLTCLEAEQSFPVSSGPWGKGELPEGVYDIRPPLGLDPGEKGNPYRDRQGFAWFARLIPRFKTERTGLGIHPDGNVPGTLGCIGLTDGNTREAYNLLWPGGVLYVLDSDNYALPLKGGDNRPA